MCVGVSAMYVLAEVLIVCFGRHARNRQFDMHR